MTAKDQDKMKAAPYARTVNLTAKLSRIDEFWSPRVVAEINDYQVKLVKIKGTFVWHKHKETDEAFLVLDGAMHIELRDRIVPLAAGDLFVVPKGVEHKPFAANECHVLLIELRGVVNTGAAGSNLQAENDVWV